MVDYESDKARYWRACDVWTFSEVLFLLNGEWPTGDRSPPSSLTIVLLECLNEIVYETENIEEDGYLFSQETEVQVLNPVPDDVPLRQIVEDAVAAGRLSPLVGHKSPRYKRDFEYRFLPSEVIAWATSRGCFPDFPFTETHAAIDRLLHPAQTAAPVVTDSASTAPNKVWTPEKLAEVKAHREKHGTKKTAAHYQVSESRIRKLLPGDKPKNKGYSAFTHHTK